MYRGYFLPRTTRHAVQEFAYSKSSDLRFQLRKDKLFTDTIIKLFVLCVNENLFQICKIWLINCLGKGQIQIRTQVQIQLQHKSRSYFLPLCQEESCKFKIKLCYPSNSRFNANDLVYLTKHSKSLFVTIHSGIKLWNVGFYIQFLNVQYAVINKCKFSLITSGYWLLLYVQQLSQC